MLVRKQVEMIFIISKGSIIDNQHIALHTSTYVTMVLGITFTTTTSTTRSNSNSSILIKNNVVNNNNDNNNSANNNNNQRYSADISCNNTFVSNNTMKYIQISISPLTQILSNKNIYINNNNNSYSNPIGSISIQKNKSFIFVKTNIN